MECVKTEPALPRRSKPAFAVGALKPGNEPELRGTFLLFDTQTGLGTTCAHVVLDCNSPWKKGVAIGVGSADRDVEWLWHAQVVCISFPPSVPSPGWQQQIADRPAEIPIASGAQDLDLAVLRICGRLDGAPLTFPLQDPLGGCFAALPLGDSDKLIIPSEVLVYGFGQSTSNMTKGAKFTKGIISQTPTKSTGKWLTIDAVVLAGHSGGMVLDTMGSVVGWCVLSQMDGPVASGVSDARPINELRPALQAALDAVDPERTGATLEEKLRGWTPGPTLPRTGSAPPASPPTHPPDFRSTQPSESQPSRSEPSGFQMSGSFQSPPQKPPQTFTVRPTRLDCAGKSVDFKDEGVVMEFDLKSLKQKVDFKAEGKYLVLRWYMSDISVIEGHTAKGAEACLSIHLDSASLAAKPPKDVPAQLQSRVQTLRGQLVDEALAPGDKRVYMSRDHAEKTVQKLLAKKSVVSPETKQLSGVKVRTAADSPPEADLPRQLFNDSEVDLAEQLSRVRVAE